MIDPAFFTLLIDALVKTIPAEAARGGDGVAFARMLLEAWEPSDAMEAALAARAIAAHLAAMDGFARAAKPGISDETAVRLRANAIAAGRQFDHLLQTVRRQPALVATPRAPGRTAHNGAPHAGVRHRAELALTADATQPTRRVAWRHGPGSRHADRASAGVIGPLPDRPLAWSASPASPYCGARMALGLATLS
jgi:hypothetical protein